MCGWYVADKRGKVAKTVQATLLQGGCFDARSHVDAVCAKRTPQKFPRLRLPREANFCVLSPPPLTLRPTVRTAFRRAVGTIIATTKEE
ncbi:hypothetical protein CN245_15135 [Sinorhizobium meliloti]|nr:hypothetical protein CN245_15135 [Sinorhizobium meliloti]